MLATDTDLAARWRQLRALDLAQELSFFPPGYYGETPTPEELLAYIKTDMARMSKLIKSAGFSS